MIELGQISIYKEHDGMIRMVLNFNEDVMNKPDRLEGIEGHGESVTEALEDLYISADLIGE